MAIDSVYVCQICKVTARRNTEKLCITLLDGSQVSSKPVVHGKNYEAKALKAFNVKYGKNAKKCGFFVCKEKPFLGASPDAMLDDGTSLVEIKCPYNGRNDEIKPGPNFKFLYYDQNDNIV